MPYSEFIEHIDPKMLAFLIFHQKFEPPFGAGPSVRMIEALWPSLVMGSQSESKSKTNKKAWSESELTLTQ